jgi:hypothetical protein
MVCIKIAEMFNNSQADTNQYETKSNALHRRLADLRRAQEI